MYLLLVLTAQTLRLCIRHIVITLSFSWLSAMGLIYSFADQILGIGWLSQNRVGGFSWINFRLLYLLATLETKKVCFLLSGCVWWPSILLSCQQAVFHYAIYKKNKFST